MSVNLQTCNGKQVTATNVEPPTDWTRDYEEMGGDQQWGPDGEVNQVLQTNGIDGNAQPLFATQPSTGEAISLFEVGSGNFYLYNAIEGALYVIKHPSDLKSFVAFIDDKSKGLASIELEAL